MPSRGSSALSTSARSHGVVEIANRNSPSQNVLSGERPAVEAAIKQIEEDEPAVQAIVIERLLALFRYSLMAAPLRPGMRGRTQRRIPRRQ